MEPRFSMTCRCRCSLWDLHKFQIDRKSTRLNSSHTVIYTLSLHDALPILSLKLISAMHLGSDGATLFHDLPLSVLIVGLAQIPNRSEEHTSELQSHRDLHSFPTRRSSDLVFEAHQCNALRF